MGKTRQWGRRILAAAATVGMMVGAGVVTAAPAQATNTFVDGSFEYGYSPTGGFARYFAPSTMGGWTVTQGSVDLAGAGFWDNADGNQSVDLDGEFYPGGVSQVFGTVPLVKHRVTYALAGNILSGPLVKTGQVLANGNVIQNFAFDISGSTWTDMGYVHKRAYFFANSPHSELEFRSTTGSGYGPVIDAVRVESCLVVICF